MYVASRLSTSNCVLYSLFQWLSSKALYYSLRTSLVLIGNDLKECWVVQLFTHDIHQNIWFIRFERLLVIGPLRMKGLFLTICCLLRHVEPSWDLCLCFSCQYKNVFPSMASESYFSLNAHLLFLCRISYDLKTIFCGYGFILWSYYTIFIHYYFSTFLSISDFLKIALYFSSLLRYLICRRSHTKRNFLDHIISHLYSSFPSWIFYIITSIIFLFLHVNYHTFCYNNIYPDQILCSIELFVLMCFRI